MTAHNAQWDELLHESLDGELTQAERVAFEQHFGTCEHCQTTLAELTALDRALHRELQPLSLDTAFDARLFEQIDSQDEAAREAARARAQADIEREQQLLTRHWRRTLITIVPSIVAGIALAFALASYVETTPWMSALLERGALQFGPTLMSTVQTFLMSSIGAAVGFSVARWLSSDAR